MADLAEYLTNAAQALLVQTGEHAFNLLFSARSSFFIVILLITLAAAIVFAIPRGRRRPVKFRVLMRALFPKRMVKSASARIDMAWTLFSLVMSGGILGIALYSSTLFTAQLHAAIGGVFPSLVPSGTPEWVFALAMTGAMWLSYEFAYWLNHMLSHRVPLLWHFHKAHHTADSLSILTVFRVHPVDTIVFYNMVAFITGATAALITLIFGRAPDAGVQAGATIFMLFFTAPLVHLQHSHLWISFTGRLGRWMLSPAHHQIHHSTDPAHFDRNFGNLFAFWDRVFGTLHVPARRRQRLTFGVDGLDYDPQTISGALWQPFADAIKSFSRPVRRPADPAADRVAA